MSGNPAPQETRSSALQKIGEAPTVDPRALRARRLPFTPVTVITQPGEDAPASPMVLLSAALLHKLLATARAIGPRREKPERPPPERLDIKV